MFATPLTLTTTLPFAAGMLTLDVPFAIAVALEIDCQLRFPAPSVCRYCPELPPVSFTLLFEPKATLAAAVRFAFPVTARLVTVALPVVASKIMLPAESPLSTLKYFSATVPHFPVVLYENPFFELSL
jgi:hypothetical protein